MKKIMIIVMSLLILSVYCPTTAEEKDSTVYSKEYGSKYQIHNMFYSIPLSWKSIENDYGGYYHYASSNGDADRGLLFSLCEQMESDQDNVGNCIRNLQSFFNGMYDSDEDIPIILRSQGEYLAATYDGVLKGIYTNTWAALDGEYMYVLMYTDSSIDHTKQDTAFNYILDTVSIGLYQNTAKEEFVPAPTVASATTMPTSIPKATQKVHSNRGNVNAVPVGKETSKLSYEIVDSGIEWWNNSIGNKDTFAFIAIKNTDSKYIYLDGCNFEYEDDDGHYLDNESLVNSEPNVIAPGEVGYYYVGGFTGGSLGNGVNTLNGVNLVAQFSLKPSTENIDTYEVFDDSLSFENDFGQIEPVIKGRIKNNTNEDDNIVYVVAVLKNKQGNVLWISGTNITDLYAGATIGFSVSMWFMSPYIKNDDIASYDIIAKPPHYQW